MTPPRPLSGRKIDQLEALAEANEHSVVELRRIMDELEHRGTSRAAALRQRVSERVRILSVANVPRSGRRMFVGELLRLDDAVIVQMILDDDFNDDVLTNQAAWRRICEARARCPGAVPDDVWERLCARRGRIMTTYLNR